MSVSFRPSVLGHGKVAIFSNRSKIDMAIVVDIVDAPTYGQHAFRLKPLMASVPPQTNGYPKVESCPFTTSTNLYGTTLESRHWFPLSALYGRG